MTGSADAFALFDTAIGPMGIAWCGALLTGTQLPEATVARTKARLQKRYPEATVQSPSPMALDAIAQVQALLATGRGDLSGIALDMAGLPEFDVAVWTQCRAIPAGQTRSYGEIARALGDVILSRRVGQALGRNPFAPIIPCHRVLGVGGKAGGFSGGAGVKTKLRLLNLEQASTGAAPSLFGALPLAIKPAS